MRKTLSQYLAHSQTPVIPIITIAVIIYPETAPPGILLTTESPKCSGFWIPLSTPQIESSVPSTWKHLLTLPPPLYLPPPWAPLP